MRPFRRRPGGPLLVRAATDPDAFAAFYELYAERVLVFLVRRVLDPATAVDLLSETFAIAFEQRASFRGTTSAEEQAWLFAIGRSQLSRLHRRGETERHALRRAGVDVPALTDAELERLEELADLRDVAAGLREALAALPEDRRRAVQLRVVDELGYDEVARHMGVTPGNARALVSRGLRQLGRALTEPGGAREPERVA